MNLGDMLNLLIIISILVFPVQRTEPQKRRIVVALILIPGMMIGYFVISRSLYAEGCVAFFGSLLLNLLFWVLIGRYNPVTSSEEIKVLGLDD